MMATTPVANLLLIRSPEIHHAVRFYQELGLVFVLHSHGSGPEHYSAEVSGFVFEIYPQRSADDTTTNVRLGFSVDDVGTVVESLRRSDVEIVTEPQDTQWGRRAVVKDFDGHTIELLTPAEQQF